MSKIPTSDFWATLINSLHKEMEEGGGYAKLIRANDESCMIEFNLYIEGEKQEPEDTVQGRLDYLGKQTFTRPGGQVVTVDLVWAGGFVVEACGPLLYGVSMCGGANWEDNPIPLTDQDKAEIISHYKEWSGGFAPDEEETSRHVTYAEMARDSKFIEGEVFEFITNYKSPQAEFPRLA